MHIVEIVEWPCFLQVQLDIYDNICAWCSAISMYHADIRNKGHLNQICLGFQMYRIAQFIDRGKY